MRRARRAAVAAGTVALAVALAVPTHADLASEKSAVDSKIDAARESLEGASAAATAAGASLAAAEARLQDAKDASARAAGELAAAQSELQGARAAEAAAQVRLDAAKREYEESEHRVAEAVRQVEGLVRAVFKAQSLDPLSVALGGDSPSDFPVRVQMIETVAADNNSILRLVNIERARRASLRSQMAGFAEELTAVREKAQAAEERAASKAAAVAAAEARVGRLVDERAGLLAKARSFRAAEQRRVDSLEAESNRLARLIASQTGSSATVRAGRLHWPTAGGIHSGYGQRFHPILNYWRLHAGVDIGGAVGAPIHAGEDGVVIGAGWGGGYGNRVMISHGTYNGSSLVTVYAHMNSIAVREGQSVSRGQVIGGVGSTGLSTGPHLHYEVRLDGAPVDPAPWLG